MNLKAAYRYQLNEFKKSVMVYYLVVVLVILFFGVTVSFADDSHFQSSGGIEMSTVIFLFVVGLNSFKETFLMLLQNGISRKTMFFGRMAAAAILCTGMMAIDHILVTIITKIIGDNSSFRISGLYTEFFYNRMQELGFLQRNFESILFTLCFYIIAFSFGYFITTAYYRMNKAAKVAVSVGLPTGFFFVLPLVDSTITNGRISRFLGYMFGTVLGLKKGQPYNFYLSSLVAACVFLGLSWFLIRRAVDNK